MKANCAAEIDMFRNDTCNGEARKEEIRTERGEGQQAFGRGNCAAEIDMFCSAQVDDSGVEDKIQTLVRDNCRSRSMLHCLCDGDGSIRRVVVLRALTQEEKKSLPSWSASLHLW